MKKEDFKDIFNPVFMETIDKIIKNEGLCGDITCKFCPFGNKNTSNLKYCGLANYRGAQAKTFKKLVEDEEFKIIQKKTKENIKKVKEFVKVEEFKIGDRVRNTSEISEWFNVYGKISEVYEKSSLVKYGHVETVISNSDLEKIEDKQQVEHFELKLNILLLFILLIKVIKKKLCALTKVMLILIFHMKILTGKQRESLTRLRKSLNKNLKNT